MSVCAVIVAGGQSSRMGREKAFELVRGRSILQRIVATITTQVAEVVINANGGEGRFGATGLQVIPDLRPDVTTPLAGVHAAISHAAVHGFSAVLTVPSDTPFLPADLVRRLTEAKQSAAIAASGGQQHYLTGLWSVELLPAIERALDAPRTPRLQDWCRMCDTAVVTWPAVPHDPFFNVNTPEELAEAERIAAQFAP